jgi:hypothetical protein
MRHNRRMNVTSRRLTAALACLSLGVVLVACEAGPAESPGAPVGCIPVAVEGPDGRPLDLSGAWDANDDGVYYIKQIDSCVWWSGLSEFEGQVPGHEWVMTFYGQLSEDGRIRGEFVDVKGTNPGAGTMTIRVENIERDGVARTELYREEATGHTIGVTFWQRRVAEPEPEPPAEETPDPEAPDDEAPDPEPPAEETP